MEIKTNGNQAFNVPNDGLGRTFVHMLKRYKNKDKIRVRVRGRGPRSDAQSACCPQSRAKWLAVYVEEKKPGYDDKTQCTGCKWYKY